MGRVLRPGPASMKGLAWLATVGQSPFGPVAYPMTWSEVATRNHARRLERGWLERCPVTRGHGLLFLAIRKGITVLGLPLIAAVSRPRHAGMCASSGPIGILGSGVGAGPGSEDR